ncbi:MAG: biopolymer transporter ExbD [Flavobacteriales bacterium]|nr:biopolymer transporter ExbD [Flavobacteriales bacterium]MDP4730970.1 biopolymer transporter ExbD [Flavobacteriales bacterium]MDP4818711.1 biopolymer transporter ExbD [Flavobacteriales bacterium]MDP5075351.1 biopolymer transporter ExbD [Flavobacteriales bacterium]
MAEIIEGGGGHEKGGKKRPKKSPVRMDMTPMVDLAFLLLTFFILATSLSKPKTLEIVYPKEVDRKEDQTQLDDDLATTIVVGETDDQVFYYHGKFRKDTTKLEQSDFSKDGLRVMLLERNKKVIERVNALKDQQREELKKSSSREEDEKINLRFKDLISDATNDSLAPFVIVKTMPTTKWKNVVNAIDELNITNVKKRAIMDMEAREALLFLTPEKVAELKLK